MPVKQTEKTTIIIIIIYWEHYIFSSITHKMPAPVPIKVKSRIPTGWPKDQAHYIF